MPTGSSDATESKSMGALFRVNTRHHRRSKNGTHGERECAKNSSSPVARQGMSASTGQLGAYSLDTRKLADLTCLSVSPPKGLGQSRVPRLRHGRDRKD